MGGPLRVWQTLIGDLCHIGAEALRSGDASQLRHDQLLPGRVVVPPRVEGADHAGGHLPVHFVHLRGATQRHLDEL